MDALFYVLPSAPKRCSFYYMAIDERLALEFKWSQLIRVIHGIEQME